MKINDQLEKYFENIIQSENNCRTYLQKSLTRIIARYPCLENNKNAITWKPLFRRKSTFFSKLDLSEAIT